MSYKSLHKGKCFCFLFILQIQIRVGTSYTCLVAKFNRTWFQRIWEWNERKGKNKGTVYTISLEVCHKTIFSEATINEMSLLCVLCHIFIPFSLLSRFGVRKRKSVWLISSGFWQNRAEFWFLLFRQHTKSKTWKSLVKMIRQCKAWI